MIPHKVTFGNYNSAVVELKGGMNENVSSLELEAGELVDCKNYMMAEGGYGGYLSVKGFERMDGILLPSEYVSQALTLSNCDTAILDNDVLTGLTSGATVTSLENGRVISGSYLTGDATVEVQVLIGTLSLETAEVLDRAGTPVGTVALAEPVVGGTDKNNLGIQYIRGQVIEVPGDGPILALHIFETKVYAFRKKVGADEIGMYVEDSVSGWLEVSTALAPITYVPGEEHDFHFSNYNFFADTEKYTMYWTDGQNQARAYDGTGVTVIDNVGMGTNDKPINIISHNYHLWLVYRGGSLQYSQLGYPNSWDAVLGAGEIGLGDEVTNLEIGVGSSLIIFLQQGIRILNGTVDTDFVLEVFSRNSGAYQNTTERLLGTIFFVDDRGVTTMQAVQEFGDYAANSISQKFKQTLFDPNHEVSTTLTNRDLNQYRIFFDDRTAIFVSFEAKELRGATFIEYSKDVNVAAQGEDDDKRDLIVFASSDEDGYVYKMDSGTSFDGTPITCRMSTAFYHYKSPRRWKLFRRATMEIAGENGQEFDLKVDFDYNELGSPRTIWYNPMVYTVDGGAVYGEGRWGIMKYGVGTAATNRVPIYLQGAGTNMSYKMISNETYRTQHIIQNIITDYESVGRRV